MKAQSKMVYFLSETHFFSKDQSLLVVNIVGPLTKKNMFIFRQCQEQIYRSRTKWVVLNFRDVPPEFDVEFLPLFDELRVILMEKAAQVRFSGLHPQLKQTLTEQKLVQQADLTNNLAEALQTFPVSHTTP